jgi:hypothetical protein
MSGTFSNHCSLEHTRFWSLIGGWDLRLGSLSSIHIRPLFKHQANFCLQMIVLMLCLVEKNGAQHR